MGNSVRLRELPLAAAPRLARLIDRARIDVIHAHWRADLPLAAIAKWLSRAGQKKAREQFGVERHYRELEAVVARDTQGISRVEVTGQVRMQITAGTFNRYLGDLRRNGQIQEVGARQAYANDMLSP